MLAKKPHARERILDAAYDLFSRHGVRAVGIDTIIARSGVARMTLYRHFASKDELVLAFLARRDERWTRQWLMREVQHRATEPRQRPLAIFDALDDWFQQPDFEGCSFIKVLLETAGSNEPLQAACAKYLAGIRAFVASLAVDANLAEPDELARQVQMLMQGSIVAATDGDRSAAKRAKEMAVVLLARWSDGASPDARSN